LVRTFQTLISLFDVSNYEGKMSKRLLAIAVLLFGNALVALDAAKVEPTHYHVAFENEHVRVVDMHYGPHEKSAMHQHAAGVAVCITAGHFD
jgi:hypothetical protein